MSDLWAYRAAKPSDTASILRWWVSSYRKSKWAGTIPNNAFHDIQGEAIRQLLVRGAKVTMACNPADDDQVLGFIVSEKTSKGEPVVHYLFVKDLFRRKGVASGLLEEAGVPVDGTAFYTHKTAYSKHFRGKFVPEIARRRKA